MNPLQRAPKSETLFRQLAQDTTESATIEQFVQLYRQSPELRHWLREDFSRDAGLRAKFDELATADGKTAPARFSELTEDADALKEERRRLKARVSDHVYGGLKCADIEKLILRYQSGSIDQGAFLLAHEWQQAGDAAQASPVLARGAVTLVDSALRTGQLRLLRHLSKASRFLKEYDSKSERRASVGFNDWWKLHALFFILRNPRSSYRTRDLRAHLMTQGLDVSTKDIRRFCTRHKIQRDMRAGRPRKSA